MKKDILHFQTKNLISIHFFTKSLTFPVAIATYSDWEKTQVKYLEEGYERRKYSTEDICLWCIRHKMQYQIIGPDRWEMFYRPFRWMAYRKLIRKIERVL